MSKDKPFVSLAGRKPQDNETRRGRLKAFRNQITTQAVVEKLVPALIQRPIDGGEKKKTQPAPDQSSVMQNTNKLATAITDAKNMRSVLPDIEMVEQLLVSSILSPHDLLKTELNFRLTDDVLRDYGQTLLGVVEDYFKKDYKIESLLERSLKKILFQTGSNIIAVIPESAVDAVINSDNTVMANESLMAEFFDGGRPRPYGVLGPSNKKPELVSASRGKKTTMESVLGFESLIPQFGYHQNDGATDVVALESMKLSVTDNPNVLKTPAIKNTLAKNRLAGIYEARNIIRRHPSGTGKTEDSLQGKTQSQTYNRLFKARSFRNKPVTAVPGLDSLDRASVGHPLVMNLPSEAVIPVFVPGSPEKHLGYYVAMDATGFPLSLATSKQYMDNMLANATSLSSDLREALGKDAARAANGIEQRVQPQQLADMNRLYCELVEDDLTSRIHNGIYGPGAQLSRPTEVYQIMLARTLAGQQTQLLFIPAEMVTYMAFDYNELGQGVSLMEQNKNTGVIRSILTVANTMGAINNSVNHVKVNLKLDPEDPDPHNTVDMVQHEIARTRQFSFPSSVTSLTDLSDFMQRAGISMAVTGNEAYPETEVDVESVQSQRVEVNGDLAEEMKKRHYLGFGVTPEQVDQTMGADFASSVLTQNLLTAKRAFMYGKEYSAYWTDHVRKYTLCDETLLEALREKVRKISIQDIQSIINESNGLITTAKAVDKAIEKGEAKQAKDEDIEAIVMTFISLVETTLPEPDLTQFNIQKEAYQEYSDSLDQFLDSVINSDMYTSDSMGEVAGAIGEIRAAMKADLQRKWLIKNNVMPELFDIINLDNAGKDPLTLLDRHASHMDMLAKSILGYAKKVIKRKEVYDAIFGNIGGEEGSGDDTGSDDTPPDDTGGADDGMSGGTDDFDMGLEETPPEENPEGEGDATPPEEGAADSETGDEAKPGEESTETPLPDA